MKIKSDFIWAVLLIATAAIAIYLGAKEGSLKTEEAFQSKIEIRDKRIKILENKVQQLSEELTSRGIFSYPQATLVTTKKDTVANVVITLNGREEIKNLEITRKLMVRSQENSAPLLKRVKTVSIGTLNAHNPVNFEVENFEKELLIQLIFKSGKNLWNQYIMTRKNSKGEIKTFWVITNRESEVIDKHIDEGFPVNKEREFNFGIIRGLKYSEIRMNSIFRSFAEE